MRRLAPLFALALLLAGVAPALAHAELLRAEPGANASLPAAPAQVELFFSEALVPAFSRIQVLDASGALVDNADSRLNPADLTHLSVSLRSLPDGVYTVSWQVLSAVDGHVTAGAFPFAVGDVDAAALAAARQAGSQVRVSAGQVAARWLIYLGAAVLAGSSLFSLLVWEPALRRAAGGARSSPARAALPAGDPGGTSVALPDSLAPYVRALARLALAALLAGNALALLAHAGQAAGQPLAAPWSAAVGQVLFHTRFGALWVARVVLALALAGLLLGPRSRRDLVLAAAASGLVLLTLSLASHAAAEASPLLPVLGDWVHLAAASTWVGGLASLALVLAWERRAPTAAALAGGHLAASLVPRFSGLALVSVGVLVGTGVYLALLRFASPAEVTSSPYGRVLLVKLGLAVPMLLLGARNLYAGAGDAPEFAAGREAAWHRVLRWATSAEMLLGAAVLLVVGLFTALPSPRLPASAPARVARARADDLGLRLSIRPGAVGVNTFELEVTRSGQPVPGASEVVLRFTPASGRLAASETTLAHEGGGRYTARGAYLSLPEAWQVQAVVRRPGEFDAFANFDFDLAAGASAAAFPWHRLTGGLLLAGALLCLWAASRAAPGTGSARRVGPPGLLPALALFAVGAAVFYLPPPAAPARVNPIAPSAESVAAGRALYEANCLACHGPQGLGDGPVGLTLNPRPADLRAHAVPGVHSDGQLYDWIHDGFPGSVMPAFGEVVTSDQIWHLVNYVRTLAP